VRRNANSVLNNLFRSYSTARGSAFNSIPRKASGVERNCVNCESAFIAAFKHAFVSFTRSNQAVKSTVRSRSARP